MQVVFLSKLSSLHKLHFLLVALVLGFVTLLGTTIQEAPVASSFEVSFAKRSRNSSLDVSYFNTLLRKKIRFANDAKTLIARFPIQRKLMPNARQLSFINLAQRIPVRRKQVVLLLTNFRSGSTFLGELFNQNRNAYYQYEPLFPFAGYCSLLAENKSDFLLQIMKCNFTRANTIYREAFKISNITDKFAQCLPNNMCSYTKNTGITGRYKEVCKNHFGRTNTEYISEKCGRPFDLSLLAELCNKADIIAYKVIRICSIKSIGRLMEEFSLSDYDFRIIHLVRDPRGVVSSVLKLRPSNQPSDVKNRASALCERYRNNLNFDEIMQSGKSKTAWATKYLRIRYEDLAGELSKTAQRVYRFLGRDVPTEVKDWIGETQPNLTQVVIDLKKEKELIRINKTDNAKAKQLQEILNKAHQPHSTVRDSREFGTKWRKALSLQNIFTVQNECQDVMKKLGYQTFSNKEEVDNYATPFFIREPDSLIIEET